jgi:hypothetical protein
MDLSLDDEMQASQTNLERRVAIFIVLLATMLCVVDLFTWQSEFPYSPDSASYIEQARTLVGQGKLLSTPWGIHPVDVDYIPPRVFPPGFPIAIASLSFFGVEPQFGAVLISSVAAVLLPLFVFLSFYRLIGPLGAAIAALLGSLSGGVLALSGMALTDCLALLLAVICVGILLNSERLGWIAVAGLIAGYGYSVRNALLALLVSPIIYFASVALLLSNPHRAMLKCLAFASGAAPIVLLLLAYNLAVYGVINPYSMPPSTVPLSTNIRNYAAAISADITGISGLSSNKLVAVIGILFLSSLNVWIFYSWSKIDLDRKDTILLCAIYICVGSVIVILARTRYQWGEAVNWRHTLQYTPFLAVVLLAMLSQKRVGITKELGWRLCFIVIALFVVSEIGQVLRHSIVKPSLSPAPGILEYSSSELCGSRDAFVVSNWAWIFRIRCNQPARSTVPQISTNLLGGMKDISDAVTKRELRLGLFPGAGGFDSSDFPLSQSLISQLNENNWALVKNGPQGAILFRPKP